MRRAAPAGLIVALWCAALAAPVAAGDEPKEIRVASPAFLIGGEIPLQYACSPEASEAVQKIQAPFEGGQNISPPLKWSKPPKGTKEIAVLVEDVDVFNPEDPEDRFVHWGVWRLKPKLRELEEGTLPSGAREIDLGYLGPCPPEPHTYEFRVFALRKKLVLEDGVIPAEFGEAIQAALAGGRVIGRGSVEGTFTPPV